jgi:thiamine-phosphate diphosphorylase
MMYLITNRKLVKKGTLLDIVESAAKAGVKRIILREKDLMFDELFPIAKQIQEKIQKTNTNLIINGNLKVAKAIKADGYHSGFNDFIKQKPDYDGLLGVSVHSIEEGILAQKHGASYLLAGHVFETDCKKRLKPRGVKFISELKFCVNIPVIALGGIKPENTIEVLETGADGVAVMSSIMQAEDPYFECCRYLNQIKRNVFPTP